MAEEIHTGGLKKFVRGKEPKIEPELARKIDEGYEKARIRKRKNKIIIVVIVLILLILGLGFIFLR